MAWNCLKILNKEYLYNLRMRRTLKWLCTSVLQLKCTFYGPSNWIEIAQPIEEGYKSLGFFERLPVIAGI